MSSKGKFVSGEEISKQLYVSRNAVWKAINSLRADGFIIDAAQNKGYLLSGGETDDFTRYGILRIRQLLKKSAADADITIKDTVTSTNTLLRISAENGAPSKTVLIANEQTEGRGRHGKSFYSPADTGIYMSVLLRPDFKADKAFFITAGAAVSVVRAIEKVCGIKAGIKWINDIMLNGKKICGILTEAVTDFESGSLQYGTRHQYQPSERRFPVRDFRYCLQPLFRRSGRKRAEMRSCRRNTEQLLRYMRTYVC